MNANIAAVNKFQQTPQDLAERLSDVWELLHQEAEWRNLLEMQRPCRVSLVRRICCFHVHCEYVHSECCLEGPAMSYQGSPHVRKAFSCSIILLL